MTEAHPQAQTVPCRRAQHEVVLEVENLGTHPNAHTSREQIVYKYKAQFFCKGVISDIILNSKLKSAAIEGVRDYVVRQRQDDYERVVIGLGRLPGHAPNHRLNRLPIISSPLYRSRAPYRSTATTSPHISKTNHTADRMVLVGTGGVDYSELVKAGSQKVLLNPPHPIPLGRRAHPKARFDGSEVPLRDDDILAIQASADRHPTTTPRSSWVTGTASELPRPSHHASKAQPRTCPFSTR